jgi:hypothetical protein
MPTAELRYFPTFSRYMVNRIMRVSGIAPLSTDATSAPFSSGIARSKQDQIRFERHRSLHRLAAVHCLTADHHVRSG